MCGVKFSNLGNTAVNDQREIEEKRKWELLISQLDEYERRQCCRN
jgi:hypothetical protein